MALIKFAFKPSGKYKKLQLAADRAYQKFSDIDEKNAERIKELFESCSKEEELVNLLINPLTFYTEPSKEPQKDILEKVVSKYRIVVTENFHLPHLHQNENGDGILSTKKLSAFPLYIRSNQQIALKEGKSAKEDTSRNITGQVSGKKSKSGAFTDAEISVTITQGADAVMRELLGAGSHDLKAKQEMKSSIYRTGEVSLKDLPNESKDKKSLIYFDHILKALGLDTDLISTPLKK